MVLDQLLPWAQEPCAPATVLGIARRPVVVSTVCPLSSDARTRRWITTGPLLRTGALSQEGLGRRTSPVVVGLTVGRLIVVVVVFGLSSPWRTGCLGAQAATSLSAGASRTGSLRARLPVCLSRSRARMSASTSAAEHANTTMHNTTATSSRNSTTRASTLDMGEWSKRERSKGLNEREREQRRGEHVQRERG